MRGLYPKMKITALTMLMGVLAIAVVGLASYAAGLVVSLFTDLPSSPVIVWAMAVLGIALHLTARPAQATGEPARHG